MVEKWLKIKSIKLWLNSWIKLAEIIGRNSQIKFAIG